MLTDPRHFALRFDGNAFELTAQSTGPRGSDSSRVVEENLETILFHWGNQILPGPRLYMLGRSGMLRKEQDLLAVDELGRIHLFELKKHTAGKAELFQLISYLAQRPQEDYAWLQRAVADTLWYGEPKAACELAGLVGMRRAGSVGTKESRAGARRGIRLTSSLEALTSIARERSNLELTPQDFTRIAASFLMEEFGGSWKGPLNDPTGVLGQVLRSKLASGWKLGRTRPGIVVWMIAPEIGGALKASEPMLERGLEIRCVSVDAREDVPGREWTVSVAEPQDHAGNRRVADAFSRLLQAILCRHLEKYPDAADRAQLELESAAAPWAGKKGSASLGWRAAGGAKLSMEVFPDRIQVKPYNHWWTEGQSLKLHRSILRLARHLQTKHAGLWLWSPLEPDAICNQELVEAAALYASDYWQGLNDIGAFEVSDWASRMPEE